jgi:hypothetical protein
MQRYRVVVMWIHRKWGPQTERLAAEGTSVRRAIGNALLGFFSDKSNRERRRDAHKDIVVQAWRLPTEKNRTCGAGRVGKRKGTSTRTTASRV